MGLANSRMTKLLNVLLKTGALPLAFLLTNLCLGAPCVYTLSQTSVVESAAGGDFKQIDLTTAIDCPWTFVNTNPWIAVVPEMGEPNGNGNATFYYLLEYNPERVARTGEVQIADQILTIKQLGQTCTFTLSETSAMHSAAAEAGTVNVTTLTGCEWTVSTATSWITISSPTNNSGTAPVDYTVDANVGGLARTGVVSIAGQELMITQYPAGACVYTLSQTSAVETALGGELKQFDLSTVAGCDWMIVNTNSWLAVMNGDGGTNGSGSAALYYWLEANPTALARTGQVQVADQIFTIEQSGQSCSFTLSATSATHGSGIETNAVDVTTLVGCTWEVLNTNDWITISSPMTQAGSGRVTYEVATNAEPLARIATITIAGQLFTLTQHPDGGCVYGLSKTSVVESAVGGELKEVILTTSSVCSWAVANTNSWLSIFDSLGATNGSGSTSLYYLLEQNPTSFSRTGVVEIANQIFVIEQLGQACSFTLSEASATHGAEAQTNTIAVTTLSGCSWTVESTNSWIVILSALENTNSGSVNYRVIENTSFLGRTGSVTVAGQNFTVNQAGAPCALTLQSSNWVHRASSESGLVGAVSASECSWPVSTADSWITITSGSTVQGGAHVAYTVAANNDSSSRSGVVNIGGTVFTILQMGTACTYRLSPTNRIHGTGANSNTISVTAGSGCSWSVLNTNDWITVLSNAVGTGNQVIGYSITKNTGATLRSGVINVAGEILSITQWGTNCGFALTPNNRSHSAAPATGSVTVNGSSSACAWSIANTNGWITITSPGSGSGNGTVSYSIVTNTGPTRTGVFTVGGVPFVINQAGAPCSFVLSSASAAHGANSATGSIAVTTGANCIWDIVNTNSWVGIIGSLTRTNSGALEYTVPENGTALARTGVVTIAGQSFTIRQDGALCTFSNSLTAASHGSGSEVGSVSVTTLTGCQWTVSNTNAWISILSPLNVTNSGSVTYSLLANPTAFVRTGFVSIAGQNFFITQSASSCLYNLTQAGQSYGADAATGSVVLNTSGACAWTVQNSNTWITVTSATSGTGTVSVAYSVGSNPSSIGRTGTMFIASLPYTVTQAGASCTFTLSPAITNHSSMAVTGSVAVATPTGCGWIVNNTNSWITIRTATNSTNNGVVSYVVTNNPTSLSRTGVVTIGGQPFTVIQAGIPCISSINPTSRAHSYTAASNAVSVTSTAGCVWTVENPNSWITILSPTDGVGTGNDTVTYLVSANPNSFSRSGVVTIAGQAFTITQPPSPCFYILSQTSVVEQVSGGNGEIALSAPTGCAWSIINTNPWLLVLDANGQTNGTGGTTLYYFADSNPTVFARTGVVRVANQILTVRQLGPPCSFTLSATNAQHTSVPETNTVNVTSSAGCAWSVVETNTWITLLSAIDNSGSATVTYSVGANPGMTSRSGVMVIAGQTFTVNQSGGPCTYSINPISATLTSGNVTGLVSVVSTGNCAWVVVNTNAWIAIKSGAQGTNNGLVRYTAAANLSPIARSGNLLVAGRVHSVTQLGSPCSYTLSSTGRLHGSLFETGQVTVLTVSECNWEIYNTNSWISFTTGTNGAGTAVIGYTVEPNPNSTDRTGVVIIGDQNFTVLQLGAACSFSLTTSSASHGGLSETGTVSVVSPAGCTWDVVETNSWISILSGSTGTDAGPVRYSVAVNTSGATRTGVIVIGDRPFTVGQAPVSCSFSVAPTTFIHGFESENGVISITTSNVCPWTVIKSNSWITFSTGTNYTGSANITYSVQANPSSSARTSIVMVAGQPVTIRQAGLVCNYSLSAPSQAHGYMLSTGQVTVTSPTLCVWTAVDTNSWITLLTPSTNTGPQTVKYRVAHNPSANPRSGVLTIAGQSFSVVQNGVPFVPASNKTVQCSAPWNFDAPVLAGNCVSPGGTVLVISTVTNAGCGSSFVATRVWDATDTCGSQMLVTQVVSVVSPPPIMNCAGDKTAECGSVWTFNAPSAVEFCTGATLPITVVSTTTNAAGMCGNTFIVTRTWRATDSCGNQSTCTQMVHIVDTTPPIASTVTNKTVECGSSWTFNAPTGTDTCSGSVSVGVFSTVTNLTGCGFTATRVWELLDACSNRSTATQTVTAVDTTPPVLNCAPAKTVECGIAWNFDWPSPLDNCSGTNVTVIVSSTMTNAAGSCGGTFTATRTWEAIDACGNRNFCSQTVRAIDTTPPVKTCSPNKTVEFGQLWTFDMPSGTDSCAGTNVFITVVNTVTNAGCGPAFVATRTWQIADGCSNKVNCSQTVTVMDTTPPSITCASDKTVNCLAPWTFDTPVAIDVANGAVLTPTIVGTVTNGSCQTGLTVVRIWQATDACGNTATCSQTVFGRAVVNVSGTVFSTTNYPPIVTDKPVAGATLLGPTNAMGITADDGRYNCMFDAASNVVITPLAPTGGVSVAGINSLDILLSRKHILNSMSFDSPYKLLAADVDGSRTVDALDLLTMRRVILGTTNRFPLGLWRFVPSNFVFTNMLNPWSAPTNRIYPSVGADVAGQDFVAVKLGDVNGDWVPPVSGRALSRTEAKGEIPIVSFQVNRLTAMAGNSVVVHLSVSNFTSVTTVQGTFAWDPTILRFTGTEDYGLPGLAEGNFGRHLVSEGKLSFSWDDPSTLGVTLSNGTAVVGLHFDVIGEVGSISPVVLNDSITIRDVTVNAATAMFQALDGEVKVKAAIRLGVSAVTPSTFRANVATVAGKQYILEFTDVLPAAIWTALPAVAGDGTVKEITDPATPARQRFYRLRVE